MARLNFALILMAAMVAAGCQQTSPQADTTPVVVDTSTADSGRPIVERAAPPQVVSQPKPPPLTDQTLIFFDFDRSDIKPEYRDVVGAHASLIADSPRMRVRLEGHADERGSREYNIGLGERRAQSVRQAMMLQGVQSSQITTLSYGEEKPLVEGKGEYAWGQNRRVKIVYLP